MPIPKENQSSSSGDTESSRKPAGERKQNVQFQESPNSDSDDENFYPVDKGAQYDTTMNKKAMAYYYGRKKIPRARNPRNTRNSVTIAEQAGEEPPVIYVETAEPRKDGNPNNEVGSAIMEKPNICDYLMIYIIMGYITGIVISLIYYIFNTKKASSDLSFKWFFIVLLVLIIMIIFYNRTTRSTGATAVPLLAGFRGQVMCIAFAFLLAFTGPLMNIILNVEIMMHTLSCGHGLLRSALTPMHEIMGEPVFAVEEAVYYCMKQVRKLMRFLDAGLKRLEEPIDKMHAAYTSCHAWLEHQQNYFDGVMSSPYDRCLGAGTICVQECKIKTKNKNNTICDMQRFEWFCENLKTFPSFFDANLKEQQAITELIFKRPLESTAKIRSMFEVGITFDHTINSTLNRTRAYNELEREISKELELFLKYFQILLLYIEFVIFFMILLLVLRTIYFRWSYLGSDSFKNMYLTKDFLNYNAKMEAKYGKNDLCMQAITKKHFGYLGSLRILPIEVGYMTRTILFLTYCSLQLFTICFVDYCLFWMPAMISYHMHQTAELQPPVYIKLIIKNGGFIGDILRGLVYAFEPLSKNLIVDVQRCLPIPRPPRFLRYWLILMCCIMAWLFLLVEPYCLRQRHRILDKMYPKNAEQRAVFMYRYLSIDRDTFIKPARRRARSKDSYHFENSITNFLIRLRGFLFRISCGYFGSYLGRNCVICETQLTPKNYINCDTPGCRGVYCQWCFLESNCHCILCTLRIKYLDFSDTSDVEDSSDDPNSQPFRSYSTYCNNRQKNS